MCKSNKIRKKSSKSIKLKLYIGSPDNKSKEIKRETKWGILELLSWITKIK